jgi:hypothetical protein
VFTLGFAETCDPDRPEEGGGEGGSLLDNLSCHSGQYCKTRLWQPPPRHARCLISYPSGGAGGGGGAKIAYDAVKASQLDNI